MQYDLPAQPPRRRRVLVIGAGVIGLTTALRARHRGYEVTVVADRFAPDITSVVAGALWEWPPAVCGQHRDQLSLSRSKEWAATSYRVFTELADDPDTGVHIRPANFYFRSPVDTDPAEMAKMTELSGHVDGFRHDSGLISEHAVDAGAGAVDAYRHLAPMIDTDRYLAWLLAAVKMAGCEVRTGHVHGLLADHQDALLDVHDASAIVNCSGLGSVDIAGDTDLRPLRGAVIHAHNDGGRMPVITEAHCMSFDEDLDGQNMIFIVPRGRDRLVLGGLVEPDRWCTDLALGDYRPISDMLHRCQQFLPVLRDVELLARDPLRVGLRPYRQRNVRLERQDGTAIVHNIGHGGSGFTFSWGCADEAVDLIDQLTG